MCGSAFVLYGSVSDGKDCPDRSASVEHMCCERPPCGAKDNPVLAPGNHADMDAGRVQSVAPCRNNGPQPGDAGLRFRQPGGTAFGSTGLVAVSAAMADLGAACGSRCRCAAFRSGFIGRGGDGSLSDARTAPGDEPARHWCNAGRSHRDAGSSRFEAPRGAAEQQRCPCR